MPSFAYHSYSHVWMWTSIPQWSMGPLMHSQSIITIVPSPLSLSLSLLHLSSFFSFISTFSWLRAGSSSCPRHESLALSYPRSLTRALSRCAMDHALKSPTKVKSCLATLCLMRNSQITNRTSKSHWADARTLLHSSWRVLVFGKGSAT